MTASSRRLRVALVYPPFGPSGLPSLGISLLTSILRRKGYAVQVDYWNLAVLSSLPLAGVKERDLAYRRLSDGTLFPWNEWIYREAAFGDDAGLQQALRQAGLGFEDLAILETLRMRAKQDVARAAMRVGDADVVAIGSTFYQNLAAIALAREVKARNPKTVTVLGGANADDPMGKAHLRLHQMFDYVVSGEADHSFPALIDDLQNGRVPGDLPGLCRRDADGQLLPVRPPVPVVDLDALPHADHSDYVRQWQATGLGQVNRLAIALESSRGCWWGEHSHCLFCGLNGNGMHYRRKTFERFTAEIAEMSDNAIDWSGEAPFFFMADNILSMDYLEPLRHWATKKKIDIEFFFEIKANLRRDQTELLARSGITVVQPGIESFSTPILKRMRKGLRGIQNVAFLKFAADAGLRPVYNILCGFPGEDPADVDRMIDRLPQLFHLFPPSSAPIVEFHRYSPYHNTPRQFGLTLEPDPRYDMLFPHHKTDLAELAYRFVDVAGVPVTGFERLLVCLRLWKTLHRAGARLVEERDPKGRLWILDSRDPDQPRRTLLLGIADAIHRGLDAPQSAAKLSESLLADFSAPAAKNSIQEYFNALAEFPGDRVIWIAPDDFRADPEGSVEILNEAGLLYREDMETGHPLYLALAARAQPLQALPTLERLGI